MQYKKPTKWVGVISDVEKKEDISSWISWIHPKEFVRLRWKDKILYDELVALGILPIDENGSKVDYRVKHINNCLFKLIHRHRLYFLHWDGSRISENWQVQRILRDFDMFNRCIQSLNYSERVNDLSNLLYTEIKTVYSKDIKFLSPKRKV